MNITTINLHNNNITKINTFKHSLIEYICKCFIDNNYIVSRCENIIQIIGDYGIEIYIIFKSIFTDYPKIVIEFRYEFAKDTIEFTSIEIPVQSKLSTEDKNELLLFIKSYLNGDNNDYNNDVITNK